MAIGKLTSLAVVDTNALELTWGDGHVAKVDLGEVIAGHAGLKPIRAAKAFAKAKLSRDGWSVEWPGDIDFGSPQLRRWADEQSGEAMRPAQGYPLRLFNPGWEGNTSVKWLQSLRVTDQPYMARDETSKYTDLMPDGKARQFTFVLDTAAPNTPTGIVLDPTSDTGLPPTFTDTDNYTNDATPTFNVSGLEAGNTLLLFRDGVMVKSITVPGTGTGLTTAITDDSPGVPGDGTYGYTAQQIDPAGNASGTTAPPLVVLFPPVLVIDAKFAGGCWARLYSDQSFKGDTLTLGAAGDYSRFKTSYANVIRKWDSIEVGPKATLTAYDNEEFTQPVATFKPSQRIADLDDKLGLLENIRAVRMQCGK